MSKYNSEDVKDYNLDLQELWTWSHNMGLNIVTKVRPFPFSNFEHDLFTTLIFSKNSHHNRSIKFEVFEVGKLDRKK